MTRRRGKDEPGRRTSNWSWRAWRSDPCVKACSLAAQGLWINLLSLMAESPRIGFLILPGNGDEGAPITGKAPGDISKVARQLGRMHGEIPPLLQELENNQVFSRDEAGVIYSRRMVRDEQRREMFRNFGKTGGNPALRSHATGAVGGVNPTLNPRTKTLNPRDNPHPNPYMKDLKIYKGVGLRVEEEGGIEPRCAPDIPAEQVDCWARVCQHIDPASPPGRALSGLLFMGVREERLFLAAPTAFRRDRVAKGADLEILGLWAKIAGKRPIGVVTEFDPNLKEKPLVLTNRPQEPSFCSKETRTKRPKKGGSVRADAPAATSGSKNSQTPLTGQNTRPAESGPGQKNGGVSGSGGGAVAGGGDGMAENRRFEDGPTDQTLNDLGGGDTATALTQRLGGEPEDAEL